MLSLRTFGEDICKQPFHQVNGKAKGEVEENGGLSGADGHNALGGVIMPIEEDGAGDDEETAANS